MTTLQNFFVSFTILQFFVFNCNSAIIKYLYAYTFIFIYSFGCTFYNLSIYYQYTCILNTSNSILVLLVLCLLVAFLFLSEKLYLNKFEVTKIIFIAITATTFIISSNLFLESNVSVFIWFEKNLNQVNVNLLNGIMLVHPQLLYFTYSLLIVFSILFFKNFSKIKPFKKVRSNFGLFYIYFFSIFSFFLGSWWAEQELSWGGWWSWDFVELLALYLIVLVIFFIHFKDSFKKLLSSVIYITIVILSVRFNLINSVHNFNLAQTQNQYYYIIFIVISVLLLVFILILFKDSLKYFSHLMKMFSLIFLFFLLYFAIILYPSVFTPNYLGNLLVTSITTSNLCNTFIYTFLFFYGTLFYLIFFTKISHKSNLLVLILPLFLYFNLCVSYTDAYIFTLFFFIVLCNRYGNEENKSTRSYVNCIHIAFTYFFVLVFHQLFIFWGEFNISFYKNNILLIKNSAVSYSLQKNNFIYLFNNFRLQQQNSLITLFKDNPQNLNQIFIQPISTTFFEKKIFFWNHYLVELYNYNMQKLLQNISFNVFLSAIFFTYLSFKILSLKVRCNFIF